MYFSICCHKVIINISLIKKHYLLYCTSFIVCTTTSSFIYLLNHQHKEDNHSCVLGDMFPCSNGEKIEYDWVCDGDDDCSEGEDEKDCDGTSGDPAGEAQI